MNDHFRLQQPGTAPRVWDTERAVDPGKIGHKPSTPSTPPAVPDAVCGADRPISPAASDPDLARMEKHARALEAGCEEARAALLPLTATGADRSGTALPAAMRAYASARASQEVTAHHLMNGLAALPAPPAELRSAAVADIGHMLSALPPGLMAAPPSGTSESAAEFWDKIGTAIGSLRDDYLGTHEEAMRKNNAFYREFTHVTNMADYMSGDDKNVILVLEGAEKDERQPLLNEMNELIGKGVRWEASNSFGLMKAQDIPPLRSWDDLERLKRDIGGTFDPGGLGVFTGTWRLGGPSDSLSRMNDLIAKSNGMKAVGLLTNLKSLSDQYDPKKSDAGILLATADEQSARSWAKQLGLHDVVVKKNPSPSPDGKDAWWVCIDTEPLDKMIAGLEKLKTDSGASDGKVSLTTPRYQAWKVGFDAEADLLKTGATTLGQKTANAQSIYENMIKVLSGTIGAMQEMLRAYLQN